MFLNQTKLNLMRKLGFASIHRHSWPPNWMNKIPKELSHGSTKICIEISLILSNRILLSVCVCMSLFLPEGPYGCCSLIPIAATNWKWSSPLPKKHSSFTSHWAHQLVFFSSLPFIPSTYSNSITILINIDFHNVYISSRTTPTECRQLILWTWCWRLADTVCV